MPRPRDTPACWPRNRTTLPRIACPRCSRGIAATATTAEREFARAVALAPDDVDTRIAAAQFAHRCASMRIRAAAMLREGAGPHALQHPAVALRWVTRNSRAATARAAARAFGQALQLAPADAQSHFNLGVALQMAGDADEAVHAYQRALVLQPDFASACFNLGVLFQQQDKSGCRDRRLPAGADAQSARRRGVQEPGRGPVRRRPDRRVAREFPRLRGELPDGVAARRAGAGSQPAHRRLREAGSLPRRTAARAISGERRAGAGRRAGGTSLPAAQFRRRARNAAPVRIDVRRRRNPRLRRAADRAHRQPRRPGRFAWAISPATCAITSWASRCGRPSSTMTATRFELYFYSTTAARDAWTEKFEAVADRFDVVASLDDARGGRADRARRPRPSRRPFDAHQRRAAGNPRAQTCARADHARRELRHGGLVGDRLQAHRPLRRPSGKPGVHARDAAADGRLRLSVALRCARRVASVLNASRWGSRRTRSSSAHSSARSSCRGAASHCGATCSRACRARSSRFRPTTPRSARSTCGWPRPRASPRIGCCSCRRAATNTKTRRATRSSISCSIRCPTAASTEQWRRWPWACPS